MNKFTLSILFLSCFIVFSPARILTVEYEYGVGTAGQYHDLQAAHDAANSGDTIYVLPSFAAYDGIWVTKKLTIFGTGFDAPSPGLPTTFISGAMIFGAGADGSSLIGFGGGFPVDIQTNSILIKRNYLNGISIATGYKSNVILQNTIIDNRNSNLIQIGNSTSRTFIANNYIYNAYVCGYCIHAGPTSITINIINNIIRSDYVQNCGIYYNPIQATGAHGYIANNIIINGSGCSGNGYYNNIATGYQIPSGNSNILNVNVDSIFVNYSQNNFHLKPGSPAIGAGLNGVDCGIYGGSMPFVDGGAPGLPLITKFDSDLSGSKQSGLNVHVKAKSVRE